MQDWHFGMQVHTSVTFMSQNVQGVTQNTDFTPFSAHLGQKTAQFRPSYPPRLRKHHPQCGGIREMPGQCESNRLCVIARSEATWQSLKRRKKYKTNITNEQKRI